MSDPTFTVGDLIRAERTKRRLSQVRLAKRAGLSAYTVHNVESGKTEPSFSTLCRLARALGCTLDQLAPPLAA